MWLLLCLFYLLLMGNSVTYVKVLRVGQHFTCIVCNCFIRYLIWNILEEQTVDILHAFYYALQLSLDIITSYCDDTNQSLWYGPVSFHVTKVGTLVLVLFLLPPFFPTHKKLGSPGLFKQAKSAVKYLYGGVVCRSDSQTLSYYKNMKLLLFFYSFLHSTITHNFLSFSVECNGSSTSTSRNNIFVYVNGLLFGREV